MSALTEFLLARIAEDEAVARAAEPGPWRVSSEDDGRAGYDPRLAVIGPDGASVIGAAGEYCADLWLDAEQVDLDHIARHNPARVLAECDAKRRIVGLLGPMVWDSDALEVLGLLALPHADHPDYDQEWRP